MSPNLTLPEIPVKRQEFPTDPEAVQAWLASLPALDTHSTLCQMRDGLVSLVAADIDNKVRARILDEFRATIGTLGLKFQRNLIGLSLPLSQQTLEVARDYSDLYGCMAAGYKRIILDSNSSKQRSTGLASVCYWAIYYLLQQLRCAFGSYTKIPGKAWQEIHHIFDYARLLGVQHVEIRIPGKEDVRTVTHVYKRALMLGLSDPYQLPFRAVDKIYEALDRWAERVTLRTELPEKRQHCLFIIDSDLNQPAMPMLPSARLANGTHHLVLDTTQLVVHLRRKMTQTYNQTVLNKSKRGETDWFVTFDQVETLRNLIVKWGLHPIRRGKRTKDNDLQDCEVVVSLSSIYYVLNGNQPLPQRQLGNKRVTSELSMGSLGFAQGANQFKARPHQNWRLLDENDKGMRLLLDDTHDVQVRVGELVAVRVPSRFEDWTVGTIRWAKSMDDGRLSIGIRKIGSNVQAVAVQLLTDRQNSIDARYFPGLILNDGDNGAKESMITDKSVYQMEEQVWVETDNNHRIVQPKDVLDSTRCFMHFAFKPLDLDTRDTLDLVQPFPRAS